MEKDTIENIFVNYYDANMIEMPKMVIETPQLNTIAKRMNIIINEMKNNYLASCVFA